MNRRDVFRSRGALLAATILLLSAGAALGDVYSDLVTYDWDQSRAPLASIEADIRQAATPAARKAIEAKLLKALADAKATFPCKQFVCRMLRRTGSAASVEPLAKLLPDAKLSHPARFALQRLDCPEAGTALRKALGELKGKLLLGVVASLGARGDAQAVAPLTKLLDGADGELTLAVIRALGEIATEDAAKALETVSPAKQITGDLADARLLCADRMLAEGKSAPARRLYHQAFAKDNPAKLRVAALRGIVRCDKAKAADTLLSLMKDDDANLRGAASRFIIEIPGAAATKAFAAALAGMEPGEQVVLIDALTARGDAAAAPEVTKLVAAKDETVRIAAVRALGTIGDASSVPVLAKAAAGGGPVGQAASQSLGSLQGDGVSEAMAKLLASSDPDLRQGILKVLTTRADKTTIPAMLKAARDNDENVRKAAVQGLAAVAGEAELPDLVELLLGAKSSSERSALARALSAGAMRVDDVSARGKPIIAALAKADNDAKVLLIDILGRCGGAKALSAVRAQLKASDADVTTSAVRALHSWPDASAAGDLLKIIQTTDNRTRKVLAFRGYVRMANLGGQRGSAETVAMYARAMKLATTTAEKKSVLAGLANARSPKALALVEPLLGVNALRAEAELAYGQIAANARDAAPDEARAALKKLIAATKNDAIRRKAQGVINEMDKYRGYVSSWLVAGPYTKGSAFETAFAPEKPSAKGVAWNLLSKGVGPQMIDLSKTFPGDGRAVYAKTNVFSPVDQDVRLEMGSDDGIKVWIAAKLVHAKDASRPCQPGEDKAKARLKKGWNPVLVKIAQKGGDYAFSVRVCKPDGAALDGLRVSTEGGK